MAILRFTSSYGGHVGFGFALFDGSLSLSYLRSLMRSNNIGDAKIEGGSNKTFKDIEWS